MIRLLVRNGNGVIKLCNCYRIISNEASTGKKRDAKIRSQVLKMSSFRKCVPMHRFPIELPPF